MMFSCFNFGEWIAKGGLKLMIFH